MWDSDAMLHPIPTKTSRCTRAKFLVNPFVNRSNYGTGRTLFSAFSCTLKRIINFDPDRLTSVILSAHPKFKLID